MKNLRVRRSPKQLPQNPPLVVLSLDASLTSTGYAYRDEADQIVSGTISPGTKRGSARLWHNLKNLERLLDKVKPDVMVIEGYAMGKGPAMGRLAHIGEWGGVAKLASWQRGIQLITVTPSSLKMIVSGSGSPGKEKLQAAVIAIYKVATRQADELDAIGLLAVGEGMRVGRGNPILLRRLQAALESAKPGIEIEDGMRGL